MVTRKRKRASSPARTPRTKLKKKIRVVRVSKKKSATKVYERGDTQPSSESEQSDSRDEMWREDEEEEEVEDSKDATYNEDEGEESDYEEEPKKKKRKTMKSKTLKTPSKKTRAAATPKGKLKTGKVSIRKKRKTKKDTMTKKTDDQEKPAHPVVVNEDKNSLFATIRQPGVSIEETVDDWLDRYEKDSNAAIAELISLVLQGSGCLYTFTKEQVGNKTKPGDIEEDLDKAFPKKSYPDYPVISSHKDLKYFGRNFLEFWDTLVHKGKDSVLFEEGFLEYIVSWISSLSSSNLRTFRHTSTLCLYQIVDSLISVLKEYKASVKKLEKQIKTAKKNKEKKQERELLKTVEQDNERIAILEDTINDIFAGVFEHRFKDTAGEIRGLSMYSLGGWIKSFPEKFLKNKYTRYIGWTLFDRESAVREAAVKVLTKLYSNEDFQGQMSDFTAKFFKRMVDICFDVTPSTSVAAIKLMTVLLRAGILAEHDSDDQAVDEISGLVFDEHASIRYYAARFVFALLAKKTKKKQPRVAKGKAKETVEITWEDLLSFMGQYSDDIPSVAYYIVDTFWDLTDMFQDWEEITDLLMEEKKLNEEQSLNLIRTLNASVKKLCGTLRTTTTVDDSFKFKSIRAKQKKEDQEKAIEEMTAHIAEKLPQLLTKFQAESEKVEELTDIPQSLQLSVYVSHHLQHHFTELLKHLKDLFWKHNESAIFSNIARSFKHFLSDPNFTLGSEARSTFDELARDMEKRLKESSKSLQEAKDVHQKDAHKFSMKKALQRMSAVISVIDLHPVDVSSDMLALIDARINNEDIDDDAIVSAIHILFCHLQWRLGDILKEESPKDSDLEALGKLKSKFVEQLCDLLETNVYVLQKKSYITLLDLNFVLNRIDYSELHFDIPNETSEKIYEVFEKALKVESEAEEKTDEQKQNKILQKQLIVSSISKALIYGTLSDSIVPKVITHFLKHGKEVADTIKLMLANLKKVHPKKMPNYEFDALKKMFDVYLEDEEESSFKQFDELSARLALGHFWGRDDEHISIVIKRAVEYVFDNLEKRYRFLEGLKRYVMKLNPNDAKDILDTIDEKVGDSDHPKKVKDVISKFKKQLESAKSKKRKKEEEEEEEKRELDLVEETSMISEEAEQTTTPIRSRRKSGRVRVRESLQSVSRKLNLDESESEKEEENVEEKKPEEKEEEEEEKSDEEKKSEEKKDEEKKSDEEKSDEEKKAEEKTIGKKRKIDEVETKQDTDATQISTQDSTQISQDLDKPDEQASKKRKLD